jgi:hypothetical protein
VPRLELEEVLGAGLGVELRGLGVVAYLAEGYLALAAWVEEVAEDSHPEFDNLQPGYLPTSAQR